MEAQNRKALARLYNVSEKTFRQRLKRHGLDFGTDRVLFPTQVEKIVEKLGPWPGYNEGNSRP